AIETSPARSSSPIDNAITRRHAVMTFDSVPRIKSQRTSHHSAYKPSLSVQAITMQMNPHHMTASTESMN
ncbi:MAG TPA: hypothetical protein VFY53_08085, partial [Rhodoplanes sp.]|nr:hypothetical protein [Rhodoplanes sp.]